MLQPLATDSQSSGSVASSNHDDDNDDDDDDNDKEDNDDDDDHVDGDEYDGNLVQVILFYAERQTKVNALEDTLHQKSFSLIMTSGKSLEYWSRKFTPRNVLISFLKIALQQNNILDTQCKNTR